MRSLLQLTVLILTTMADTDKGPIKDVVYKTPTEVFEAQRAAMQRKDYQAMLLFYTRDAQLMKAATLAYTQLTLISAAEQKAELREELKTFFKGLRIVLHKHGLTRAATKKIKLGEKENEKEKWEAEVAKLIQDPVKLLVEIIQHNEKYRDDQGHKDTTMTDRKLTQLKIDKDKARGVVVVTLNGKDHSFPVEFVREGLGWKISRELPIIRNKR
jgi:hypothetical protein